MEVAASARACLVADVGGTNARVGWTCDGQDVRDVVVLRCSDHASLAHILGSYLERMARSHPGMALREAVVAIAGYLQGDRLVNANLPWEVSVARTADAARLESLVLINDFGAVAHAIPGVQRQTLVPLLPGQRDPGMQVPALVLGPGTGLGAGTLRATAWTMAPSRPSAPRRSRGSRMISMSVPGPSRLRISSASCRVWPVIE